MKAHSTATAVLFVCLAATIHAGSTQTGDITAAIRTAGGTIAVTAPGSGMSEMVNGKYNDRYLSVSGDMNPVTIDFDFGTSFLPGEDIVVTGLTFFVGGNSKTELWGNWDKRLPKSWTLSGSNDGEAWTPISTVNGFTSYGNGMVGDQKVYTGGVSFANWRSYRQYRLYVSENTGNATYYLQLTEVVFSGLYGGKVVQPEPERVDITAAVRAANAQTVETNAGDAGPSLNIDHAFNGIRGYQVDRYLSNSATTKGLLDAGDDITIDYVIDEKFARSADVIVTGYSIDVDQSYASTLERLPKSWKLQGWTGSSWKTIDRVTGFCDWNTIQVLNPANSRYYPYYSYTFSCTNSVSYRKYRLAVSEVMDRSVAGDTIQVTEIALFGYVDAGLEGKVGGGMDGMPITITKHESKGAYVPNITISKYDDTPNTFVGTVADLFDGLENTELLARMGTDADELAYAPLVIGYEMNSGCLTDKEVVLKRYKFKIRTSAGLYALRLPKIWRFEGYCDGKWRKLDSQTGFTDWTIADGLCFAEFNLPDNKLSCRNYRLLVYDVSGVSEIDNRHMHQLRLCEFELSGLWGTGISEPPPPPPGMMVILR